MSLKSILKKVTVWRAVCAAVLLAGLYAFYLRFFEGWQAATNLSDAQPWGVWVGVATLCGVGLSAGGFGIAAAVYLLGMERYRPVARVSVLVSLLGYMTVCFGYLYELGLPWRAWHIFVYWNRHSVLFDVALCIMTYTTVLLVEFAPQLLEKLPWRRAKALAAWQHRYVVGVVLAGTLLSSMHQSFLGGLFLIMKGHIYPLWYSPYIHTLFYLSAIPAGLCMVIVACYLSERSLGAKIDHGVLVDLTRMCVPMLSIYAIFRAVDILTHGGAGYLFLPRAETAYFWLEVLLMVALPLWLFTRDRVLASPILMYWAACCGVAGFVANRVNVSITSMEYYSHAGYVPKWPEMAIMVMVVAGAVVAFRQAVLRLDVFGKGRSA